MTTKEFLERSNNYSHIDDSGDKVYFDTQVQILMGGYAKIKSIEFAIFISNEEYKLNNDGEWYSHLVEVRDGINKYYTTSDLYAVFLEYLNK